MTEPFYLRRIPAAEYVERKAGQAEVRRNPTAVIEARLILENLGAARLFIDTAQMLVEVRDDVGARHSLRMAALHFKAALQSANELAALKAGGQ